MEINLTLEIEENGVVILKDYFIAKPEAKVKNTVSEYARYFNETCQGWTNIPEYNLLFLKMMQEHCNELLKSRGHLFLNEVYHILGMSRTKAGSIVGWVYDTKNPKGDNYIDFGIYDPRNQKFVNGEEKTALLDFNVDGSILYHFN